MSKSKKTQVIEKKIFSKEEINAALEIVHSEYFMNVLGLLSHDTENKELHYVRVPMTTPDGGTYLVSILHVDGPKIDLQKLAASADEVLNEKRNPSI